MAGPRLPRGPRRPMRRVLMYRKGRKTAQKGHELSFDLECGHVVERYESSVVRNGRMPQKLRCDHCDPVG